MFSIRVKFNDKQERYKDPYLLLNKGMPNQLLHDIKNSLDFPSNEFLKIRPEGGNLSGLRAVEKWANEPVTLNRNKDGTLVLEAEGLFRKEFKHACPTPLQIRFTVLAYILDVNRAAHAKYLATVIEDKRQGEAFNVLVDKCIPWLRDRVFEEQNDFLNRLKRDLEALVYLPPQNWSLPCAEWPSLLRAGDNEYYIHLGGGYLFRGSYEELSEAINKKLEENNEALSA